MYLKGVITIYLLFIGISRENRKFSGMTRDVMGFKMEFKKYGKGKGNF